MPRADLHRQAETCPKGRSHDTTSIAAGHGTLDWRPNVVSGRELIDQRLPRGLRDRSIPVCFGQLHRLSQPGLRQLLHGRPVAGQRANAAHIFPAAILDIVSSRRRAVSGGILCQHAEPARLRVRVAAKLRPTLRQHFVHFVSLLRLFTLLELQHAAIMAQLLPLRLRLAGGAVSRLPWRKRNAWRTARRTLRAA